MMLKLAVTLALVGACLVNYHFTAQSTLLSYASASFIGLLILLSLLLIWNLFLYPFYFSPYLTLPQASQSWKSIFTSIEDGEKMLKFVNETRHDGIFRALDVLNRETLIVTSPQGVRDILQIKSYDFEKFPMLKKLMKMILGEGLITVEGAQHKLQRKAMIPAFSFRHIRELYPLFWTKSSEMVTLIKRAIDNPDSDKTIEISSWAGRVALDIIGIAGFGVDFRALNDPKHKLCTAYSTALQPDKTSRLIFLVSLIFPVQFLYLLPIKKAKEIKEASSYIRDYIEDMVTKRDPKMSIRHTQSEKSTSKDILSVAVNYGGLTTKDLVNQAQTFLAAGHDTSATNLTWAMYIISQPENTQKQARLREEIRANLPSPESGIEVTAEEFEKLTYLDAVCKETTRLYGAIALTRRYCIRDTEVDGIKVKKGTYLIIPVWAINKSKALWGEDARVFKPERWLEGTAKVTGGADSMGYLTFGYGTRMCIGKGFVTAEFKALLATLVGTFEITAAENKEIVVDWHVVSKIYGGYKIGLKALDGW